MWQYFGIDSAGRRDRENALIPEADAASKSSCLMGGELYI
jgi:hypothetical protein